MKDKNSPIAPLSFPRTQKLPEDGSPVDFATVYAECRPGMIQTAMRYLGDLAAAEDVVQDTLSELWEKPEMLSDVARVETFLNRCVINRSLNYLRDHHKNRLSIEDEAQRESLSMRSVLEAQEVEESADQKETYDLLFRAIDTLPKRTREVILLKLDGMTLPQIALALDLSPETVKTHVKRAYSSLRAFLKL